MAKVFDPNDKTSWYFGRISRQDATDLLMAERDGGVFLIRDSSSIPGDFVLCVKEDCKVCHYIINKVSGENDGVKYKIGDRFFSDLPALLSFYKLHYLDTTPLVRPAGTKLEKVIAKHDFEGTDAEDLPFKKGEVLTVISKDEDQWWTARNDLGRIGSIPVPYIKSYDERQSDNLGRNHKEGEPTVLPATIQKKPGIEPNRNTYARVKQPRIPNAYDETALRLQIGDIIRVTKINISGQWEGELILEGGVEGRKGHFPFTHVELIEYDPLAESQNNTMKLGNNSIFENDKNF